MADTVVIGAGIAGLVAANELHRAGRDVVVVEAASRVGGRTVSDSGDGCVIDTGAQFLSDAYPILVSLIEELGLAADFVETSPWVAVVRDGRVRRFRYDRPLSLRTGGLLGWRELASLGWGSLRLSRRSRGLPVNDYSAWARFDDGYTEEWAQSYYQPGVLEYFVEPMLEAFYFQSPSQTSRALPVALNAFSYQRAKTMVLSRGMGSLAEVLAAPLDVRLDTAARSISSGPDGVRIETSGSTMVADRVVLATPASVARRLYSPDDPIESRLLRAEYASTINVALTLDEEYPIPGSLDDVYGVWIPRRERSVLAAFTLETRKHPARAETGELVNAMLCGRSGRELIGRPDEEVTEAVIGELERYLPGLGSAIRSTSVYRWKRAEPLSPVGRARDIAAYHRQKTGPVVLAGDYLGMPFTEGAAHSGLWAARRILTS